MKRSGEEWTNGETARLKQLLDLGLTIEEISRVLQRTTLGILYKMWQEGIAKKLIAINMRSVIVKRLLTCSSEKITGICKELYHGDYAPDRQEVVLRVLLTLDLCQDRWVAKKREEKVSEAVYKLCEAFSTVGIDFADLKVQREEDVRTMYVCSKFEELVKTLSLELNVPPIWIKDKVQGIFFK